MVWNCFNDLMVGNWLMYEGLPYRVTQVSSIDAGMSGCSYMLENGEYDCGEYIPITPEILEKNGFFFDGTCRWECDLGRGDKIYVCPVQVDNEWWFGDITGFEIYNGISDCLIEGVEQVYVHQLQNAMTLCMVNKKIEL